MYEGMPVQLADEDNDDNLEVCITPRYPIKYCDAIVEGCSWN